MVDGAAGADAGRAARTSGHAHGGHGARERERDDGPFFGALDLGSNNCRLLIATPAGDGFRVVDAFSRIVRLGEGLAESGELSPAAVERAIAALKICASKLKRRGVRRARCIATQACRGAGNGAEFLARVERETGLALEIITPDEEARLSVMGCLNLIDRAAPCVLVVDIGGGSTELSWVDVGELNRAEAEGTLARDTPIAAWTSLPTGVVSLAERFPEDGDHLAAYAKMKAHVHAMLDEPEGAARFKPAFEAGEAHLVGTSGTITSLAGVHLELPKYQRSKVDGLWMSMEETAAAFARLKAMDHEGRAAAPCIGPDRADVVLAGCAILEAIVDVWPSARLRVADRGLREGMLMSLMAEPRPRRRRRRRRGRRGRGRGGAAGAPEVPGTPEAPA